MVPEELKGHFFRCWREIFNTKGFRTWSISVAKKSWESLNQLHVLKRLWRITDVISVSCEGYNQWSEVFQTCYDYFLVINLVIWLTQNRIIKHWHCRGSCSRFCLTLVLHCVSVYSDSIVVECNSKNTFRCLSLIFFFRFLSSKTRKDWLI